MDVESIDDLLRDLNIDTDDEDPIQPATLAEAGPGDNDNSEIILTIDGTEYVEVKKIARKTSKGTGGKRSSVWKLGIELKRVRDGARFWQCLVCKRKKKLTIYTAAGTSGPFHHLKVERGVVERNKRFVRSGQEECSDSEPPTNSSIAGSFNSRAGPHLISKSLGELRFLFLSS
jgi:hypothetical protein